MAFCGCNAAKVAISRKSERCCSKSCARWYAICMHVFYQPDAIAHSCIRFDVCRGRLPNYGVCFQRKAAGSSLAQALRDRNMLLVLDDVWDSKVIEAINMPGFRGELLVHHGIATSGALQRWWNSLRLRTIRLPSRC